MCCGHKHVLTVRQTGGVLNTSTLKPCLRGLSCCFFPSFLLPFVIFATQSPNYCLHWLLDTQGASVHCGTMLPMHLTALDHCKNGAYCWLSCRSWFQIRSSLQIQHNYWENFTDCCYQLITNWSALLLPGARYTDWSIQKFGVLDSFLHSTPL